MWIKSWDVLLVDDEPDVLAVSRLAMKNISVYGVPIKLHTCESKASAIAYLMANASLIPVLTTCLIDVVMETDHAGLELCEFIRRDLHNPLTQLIVRTGQPGIAPEREVIDRYEINGYISKAEATEQKLYSVIKSCIRQYYSLAMALGVLQAIQAMMAASASRKLLVESLRGFHSAVFLDSEGEERGSLNFNAGLVVNDQVLLAMGTSGKDNNAEVLEQCRSLGQLPAVPIGGAIGGDTLTYHDRQLLVSVTTPAGTTVKYTAKYTGDSPDYAQAYSHAFVKCFATLWDQAQA